MWPALSVAIGTENRNRPSGGGGDENRRVSTGSGERRGAGGPCAVVVDAVGEGDLSRLLTWRPPGPVANAFVMCDAPLVGFMGPRGGGKTSSLCAKIMRSSALQPPSRLDGVRRYRTPIIRDQLRRFHRTTYPTFRKWLRPEWSAESVNPDDGKPCIFSTPQDAPGVQQFVWNDGKGPIFVWLDFLGLGEMSVEELMQGYESTDAVCNEWAQLPEDTIAHVSGSLGRYPSKEHCDVSRTQIYGDFNAPSQDHFLYRLFVEERPDTVKFFRQPGGREPGAENLMNLPSNYYENIVAKSPRWYTRRMVDNKWGFERNGVPVYDEHDGEPGWDDEVHVAREGIRPVPGAPIYLGVDPGFHGPAVVFIQLVGSRVLVLAEVCASQHGVQEVGDQVLRTIAQRFPGFEIGHATLDLYAFNENAVDPGRTWAEMFKAYTRIKVKRTPTNSIAVRLDGVRRLIAQRRPGGLSVDPSCRMLIRGFNADYRYKKLPSGRSPEPEKNPASDVHDALQYAVLGTGGYDLIARPNRSKRSGPPRIERQQSVRTWGGAA